MGNGIRTHLPCHLNQSPGNQGTRQGRGQGIATLVQSIRTDRGEGEFLDERLNQVAHKRLTRACIQSLLTNRLQFITLTKIRRKGDHLLHTPLLHQIGDADAGIHSAGIGKHYFFGAAHHRDSCSQSTDSPFPGTSSQRPRMRAGAETNSSTSGSGALRGSGCNEPQRRSPRLTTRAEPQVPTIVTTFFKGEGQASSMLKD